MFAFRYHAPNDNSCSMPSPCVRSGNVSYRCRGDVPHACSIVNNGSIAPIRERGSSGSLQPGAGAQSPTAENN